MAGTRDAILDALEDLTADELKKFKMKLLSVTLREGYQRIPRGTLLPMDAVDLTDKLVSSYLGPYATELTTHVLSEMGMQDTAARLQAKAARAGERAPARPLRPSLHPAPSPSICPGPFHFLFLLGSKKSASCWGASRLPALGPDRPPDQGPKEPRPGSPECAGKERTASFPPFPYRLRSSAGGVQGPSSPGGSHAR